MATRLRATDFLFGVTLPHAYKMGRASLASCSAPCDRPLRSSDQSCDGLEREVRDARQDAVVRTVDNDIVGIPIDTSSQTHDSCVPIIRRGGVMPRGEIGHGWCFASRTVLSVGCTLRTGLRNKNRAQAFDNREATRLVAQWCALGLASVRQQLEVHTRIVRAVAIRKVRRVVLSPNDCPRWRRTRGRWHATVAPGPR